MNILSHQQVRRRGSSLDEASIKASLQQYQALIEVNKDVETLQLQEKQKEKRNSEKNWIYILSTVLICFLVGNLTSLIVHFCQSPSEMGEQTPIISENRFGNCIADANECPFFKHGELDLNWVHRSNSEKETCYRELNTINSNCDSTCDMLFQKFVNETEGAAKAATACKLGCTYAIREIENKNEGTSNCHYNCKRTVWVSFPKKAQCNYNQGLGLVAFEYEMKWGAGVFGVGKACEIGCILGNSRPCDTCGEYVL
jgi:hypothetical protein